MKRKPSKYKKARKQTNAKPKVYNGIKFRSTLEVYMYKLLEKSDISFAYEGQKYVIIEGFNSPNTSYERFLNGKGDFKDRGNKKFANMHYTPDFTPPIDEELKWVIEVKGRAMPDFSRTWKLFKKWIAVRGLDTVLLMPRTEKECRETMKIIESIN
jgi:hypothetical protein